MSWNLLNSTGKPEDFNPSINDYDLFKSHFYKAEQEFLVELDYEIDSPKCIDYLIQLTTWFMFPKDFCSRCYEILINNLATASFTDEILLSSSDLLLQRAIAVAIIKHQLHETDYLTDPVAQLLLRSGESWIELFHVKRVDLERIIKVLKV